MNSKATNPYQPPEAAVEIDNTGKLSAIFERFTAWGVFGLFTITLGIYGLYWVYSRTRQINGHVDNPIGSVFINTTLVLYVIGLCSNLGEPLALSPNLTLGLGLISLIATVLWIVWIFKLRNRIHAYLGASKENDTWFGPILTFFFHVIYMQYKINKVIDSE